VCRIKGPDKSSVFVVCPKTLSKKIISSYDNDCIDNNNEQSETIIAIENRTKRKIVFVIIIAYLVLY
jgi:hypothetical protein